MRSFVKPGITGLAQVRGFRGEVTSREAITERVKYDALYLEFWSVWRDLQILFETIQTDFLSADFSLLNKNHSQRYSAHRGIQKAARKDRFLVTSNGRSNFLCSGNAFEMADRFSNSISESASSGQSSVRRSPSGESVRRRKRSSREDAGAKGRSGNPRSAGLVVSRTVGVRTLGVRNNLS